MLVLKLVVVDYGREGARVGRGVVGAGNVRLYARDFKGGGGPTVLLMTNTAMSVLC